MKTLPQLSVQVADIGQRQIAFEEQVTEQLNQPRPQLSRPLSSALVLGSTPKVASLARTMKPPLLLEPLANGALDFSLPRSISDLWLCSFFLAVADRAVKRGRSI